MATLHLADGRMVRVACSWNLHGGQDAVIASDFYGDKAGVSCRNIDGSFYDFRAELFRGTAREALSEPGDPWGGRMAGQWAEKLARSPRFDPVCEELAHVADIMDGIYAAATR